MKKIYSVFFYYMKVLSPQASDEKVSEGSFFAMTFAMYFLLTTCINLGEHALKVDIGTGGTVGIWIALSLVLYFRLMHNHKWQNIVISHPILPISKDMAIIYVVAAIVIALLLILFPLGRLLFH